MEYSYVNEEWKKNQDKNNKKKNRVNVGLSVLLSCVAMTTVVGLFAGVLLGSNYIRSRDAITASQAPTVTQAPVLSVPTAAPAVTASESTEAETAEIIKSSGFVTGGQYTRAQICEIAAPSVVGIDVVAPVSYWGRVYETEGSGSGVIITTDGYIATCAHVIEDASSIKVTLNDDTEYEASVVGMDKRNDLAIIKIEASNLVAAEIGDSDMLTVGEDVIAIGNPLGELRGTATSGIISALRRPVTIDNTVMELVQTDAAISPGNSGGGLFNASGKLIGIVNAKASGNNAEGLGFAIPINDVLTEINDLLHYGYITGRAYLGVYTQNVSLRSDYGYWYSNSVYCVQITDVVAGGAAEQAGLKAGDLILALDDKAISSNADLSDAIANYNAGDTAAFTIQREGQKQTVSVTFGEYVPANG